MIHTTVQRLALGAVSLLLAASCGGKDGGEPLQAPIADLTGAWTVQETLYGNCQGTTYPQSSSHTFDVTQSGNTLTFRDTSSGSTYTGTISGDSVRWSFSYPSGGGTTSGTLSGTVTADGNAATGTGTWTWTSGSSADACNGSITFAAARNGAVPAAPESLTARPGFRQVTLSWTAVAGVSKYNIYRSTTPGAASSGGLVYTALSGTTTVTSRGLENETTYHYVVRAVNAAEQQSAPSDEVGATPSSSYVRPSRPTGVTAVAGVGQVTISCTQVENATMYRTFMAEASGQLATYDSTSHFSSRSSSSCAGITWPYLTPGKTYYFVVTAWNLDGESDPSDEVPAVSE